MERCRVDERGSVLCNLDGSGAGRIDSMTRQATRNPEGIPSDHCGWDRRDPRSKSEHQKSKRNEDERVKASF